MVPRHRRGARGSPRINPRGLAPFFTVAAIIHAVALVSRFSDVAARLPADAATLILAVHGPLLLVASYFEGRLDYGERTGFPAWMRITSAPVRWSFTLAFTYLVVVALQTWDVNIGPIDPTPPPGWGLGQRAMFFGIMTVGMAFPNYVAAASVLVPALRAVTAPLRWLPAPVGLAAAATGGVVGGVALVKLVSSRAVGGVVIDAREAFAASPALGLAVTLALVLGPALFGAALVRRAL